MKILDLFSGITNNALPLICLSVNIYGFLNLTKIVGWVNSVCIGIYTAVIILSLYRIFAYIKLKKGFVVK